MNNCAPVWGFLFMVIGCFILGMTGGWVIGTRWAFDHVNKKLKKKRIKVRFYI